MLYHTLLGKVSQNLSSAAVVIGALRVNFENRHPRAHFAKKWVSHHTKENCLFQKVGVPASKMGVENCKLAVGECFAYFAQ